MLDLVLRHSLQPRVMVDKCWEALRQGTLGLSLRRNDFIKRSVVEFVTVKESEGTKNDTHVFLTGSRDD